MALRTEDGYIVSKCLDGEIEAFGFLVDKYRESIYGFAYSKLLNFQDAEDITQEVFIKAYQKLNTLKRRDSFLAWLYSITSNLCKEWIRNQASNPDYESFEDLDEKIAYTSHRDADPIYDLLHEALESLPEMYRQVLSLHYLSGMNYKEIASFIGASPMNVLQRLHRAREQLKEEMMGMMTTAFERQKLPGGFTFRIIELVKRVRIQPISTAKGLSWGLSAGAGLIFAILMLGQHIQINLSDISMGLPLPGDTKILKVGEIPVDAVKISTIVSIGNKGDGKGLASEPKSENDAFFMDPQGEGEWRKRMDMPTARLSLATCSLDGKVYAIGGLDRNWTGLKIVEEFDPQKNEWVKRSDMPTGRSALSASIINGKIYAIGGCPGIWGALSAVEEYNPLTDRWIKKSDMPEARTNLCTCAVNGKIYAIGGVDKGGNVLSLVEEYDPVKDEWANRSGMPTSRYDFAVSVVDGKIYAVGGSNVVGPNSWNASLAKVEEYDPVLDRWVEKNNMPVAAQCLSATAANGKIYVIGGAMRDNAWLSTVYEYDPITDMWAKRNDMPTARYCLGASSIDEKIYAIGGGISNNIIIATVEEFDTASIGKSVDPSGKLSKTWGTLKAK